MATLLPNHVLLPFKINQSFTVSSSITQTDISVAAIIKTTQKVDVEPAPNAVTTDDLATDLVAGSTTDLEL